MNSKFFCLLNSCYFKKFFKSDVLCPFFCQHFHNMIKKNLINIYFYKGSKTGDSGKISKFSKVSVLFIFFEMRFLKSFILFLNIYSSSQIQSLITVLLFAVFHWYFEDIFLLMSSTFLRSNRPNYQLPPNILCQIQNESIVRKLQEVMISLSLKCDENVG